MKEFVPLGGGPEPTRVWGSTPLFNLIDGRKLLDYCDEHDAVVLGVEGFKIIADKRIPDLDCIADFSKLTTAGEEFAALSRRSARHFLDTISNKDIFLEFILVTV
ncbi:hypothetical protein HU755_03095 [Pseudomonas sp. SWRI111]|uniref:hypothetical protein n=1 Tax=Pseudomonas sp. SWRI111 TaxID=2745507 RepID=UPI0016442CB0|nr:hypothetical protein [Pseudomonas sp. SWRI111]MBC3205757.1 hypothetical protein [Pseudomonas sp. SWRI111]